MSQRNKLSLGLHTAEEAGGLELCLPVGVRVDAECLDEDLRCYCSPSVSRRKSNLWALVRRRWKIDPRILEKSSILTNSQKASVYSALWHLSLGLHAAEEAGGLELCLPNISLSVVDCNVKSPPALLLLLLRLFCGQIPESIRNLPDLALVPPPHEHKLALEGLVVQRAECRPAVTESYMKLKKLKIEESTKPLRFSQKLEKAITTNYKPVSNHSHNVEYEKKKKEEGKRARADKQKVLEMLFSAFEKHQYYNIRDLVDITKQPVIYLKEILREIGVYNSRGPHKSTWELKPEYRHYKEGQEDEEEEEEEEGKK
ncbi:hypothetical protein DNTS_030952, partial [Danionella cerebrum]